MGVAVQAMMRSRKGFVWTKTLCLINFRQSKQN